MAGDGSSERALARRLRLCAGLGAVLQVAIGLWTIWLVPASWTAAVVAVRSTRRLDRTDSDAELWAGAALAASLVPVVTAAFGGAPALLAVATVSTLALAGAWHAARLHASVRRRRWQLERALHAAPPQDVLRLRRPSGGQQGPDGDVTEG